jgi:ankyrin repeat protein
MKYSDIKKILAKPSEQRTQEECELLAKACSGELCSNGNTALIHAVYHKDIKIALALVDAGAVIDTADKDGETALMYAAFNGHTDTSLALIAEGANVNATATNGYTALIYAASKGHTDTALALIAKGAVIDAKDKYGHTALITAAFVGHTDTVLALIAQGAVIETPHQNLTALICAVCHGHTDTALALIAQGAIVDAKNKFDQTALMYAALKGHTDTALALIAKGADVGQPDKIDPNLWVTLSPDQKNHVKNYVRLHDKVQSFQLPNGQIAGSDESLSAYNEMHNYRRKLETSFGATGASKVGNEKYDIASKKVFDLLKEYPLGIARVF